MLSRFSLRRGNDGVETRQDRVARRRALLQSALAHRIGTFSIDRPLRAWLRNRPRYTFLSGGHTFAVAFNTDGDLSRLPRKDVSTVLEPFDVSSCPQPLSAAPPPPPTYTALVTDPRILPPLNQYLCGFCWALAPVSAMTDLFSLQTLPPNTTGPWKMMSATHALACFPFCAQTDDAAACQQRTDPPPSSQCAGGNVGDLAQWIQSNGIVTDDCAPFTWCTQSASCTDMSRATAPSTLDEMIPNCTCTGPLFYVKNVQSIFLDAQQLQDPHAVLQTQTAIQQHIVGVGPVVATINVFQPWMSGQYQNGTPSLNPANVFIENQDNPGAFVAVFTAPNGVSTTSNGVVVFEPVPAT